MNNTENEVIERFNEKFAILDTVALVPIGIHGFSEKMRPPTDFVQQMRDFILSEITNSNRELLGKILAEFQPNSIPADIIKTVASQLGLTQTD